MPLFGHTPGSVGVFVNVSPRLRMFHVGDAVNLVEAVDRRLTKSVIMRSTDVASAEADRIVSRIAQLHAENPEIAILPAHDRGRLVGRLRGAGPVSRLMFRTTAARAPQRLGA